MTRTTHTPPRFTAPRKRTRSLRPRKAWRFATGLAAFALAAALALPAAQAARAERPAEEVISLAFEPATRHRAIVVRAEINGAPALLLFDTGASHTVVHAARAGVRPEELREARFRQASSGVQAEYVFRPVDLRLGERTWPQRRVAVMNLDALSKTYGRKIDGILGQDVLREFSRVSIDYARQRIELTSPPNPQP